MNRILCILAAGALFTGCATTTTSSSSHSSAKAKTSQLRQGMSQGQVKSILGSPDKVDHDDNHHHGLGYVPYDGYGRHHHGEEELTWEYNNPKVEVNFRRSGNGNWVVKDWDN